MPEPQHTMRIAALISVVLASVSVVACATSDHVIVSDGGAPASGDTSQTVPAVTDAASFCGAMCGRVQACDKAVDTQTCENECTNGNAAVFPRLRRDVVELIVGCFDKKDCKTVLGGEFGLAHGIATDSKGNIYIGEAGDGRRVQRFKFMGLDGQPAAN